MAGDRNVTISELLSVSTPTVPTGSFEVESLQVDEIATPTTPASGSVKVYAKSDKKLYTLDSTGAEKVVGSGAGGADVVKLLTADNDAISSFDDTGNNASYGNGGVITAGALAINSTAANLLQGETNVYEYDPDANGQNDFFGVVIDIPRAWRGRFLGFKCLYKTDSTYTDGDIIFQAEALDGASAGLLTDTSLELEAAYNTDRTGKDFVANFYIPTDCTQISCGFQNTTTTSTIAFYFDRFEVTADPFVIADFDNVGAWETCTFTGTWVSNTTYTARRRQNGEMMQYQVRIACSGAPTATDLFLTLPTDDTIDTAKLMSIADLDSIPSIVHINDTGTNRFNGNITYRTTTSVRVRCEVSSGTYGYHAGVDASNPMTFANTDYILCYFEVPLTRLQAKTEHIVTPTSMSQPAKVTANNTTAITGAGTLTYIGFGTTEFDHESRFTNVGSNNNTTYTSTTYYTVAYDAYYELSTQLYTADVDLDADEAVDLYFQKDGPSTTLARKLIDIESSLTSPNYIFEMTALVYLRRGDRVSVALSTSTTGDISLASSANLSHFTVKQVSTTPVLGAIPTKVKPASVSANNTTAIATATVTYMGFGTTNFDADSRFTNVGSNNNTTYTSTTYYTALRNSYLNVNAALLFNDADFDDSENYYIAVYVNGVERNRSEENQSGTPTDPKVNPKIDVVVSVVAGDKISIGFRHATGANVDPISTAGASYFQVYQVD